MSASSNRPGDGRHRRKRTRQGAGSRQCSQAVTERSQEHAERPLRGAIAHETDQDARRELCGGKRERHQGDREHNGDHRHNRRGDGRQQPPTLSRCLRAFVEGHGSSGHPQQ
jgi:hypothetical protein